jgi:hypothetical protein
VIDDAPEGPVPVWEPQPGPQSLAIAAQFVIELMYGGARGGGKSDYLLGDFLQDVWQGEKWRGIIFRRSHPELEELITRAKEIYIPLGAVYKVSERTFIFKSGATLKMRHVETESDCDKYQGHQYTWIGWDELTNWPNLKSYKKLKACLRSAHVVPNKRIRCSANPGGVGHHEVKAYFVDPAPKGMELIQNVDEDGNVTTKMFIPSRVYDNKKLLANDPGYIARLREIGSPELVRAWLEGDWNVITGAYFPEFRTDKHVIEPFTIPAHWLRFRSADWGTASPFAILWHAVSDGYQVPDGPYIPAGAIVTYREWYGWNGSPNTGLRWPASRVGMGIVKREKGGQDDLQSRVHALTTGIAAPPEKISYGVIDPAAYKQEGGPSVAETMAHHGAFFRKADNQRIAGWNQVRERLCGVDGDPEVDNGVGTPMWYCFKTCVHIIRTLPAMQHDLNNPEDADSDGEDHAPDSLRYGFMSRPWKRSKPANDTQPAFRDLRTATLDEIWQDHEEREGVYRQV